MIGRLSSAVASSTRYTSLEAALLNCVERRTGTRPSSITAVMSQYSGAQKVAADECDERGAVASSTGELALSPTRTFESLHELFKTTLAGLKNGNSVYAGYLDTPQGSSFLEDITSRSSVKFAATIVTSLVTAPMATTTAGSGTRSPTQPDIPHSRPAISDCIVPVTTVPQKINMLNCLIFDTDLEDWVTLKLRDDDGSEFEATLNRYGFDEGDYRCSEDQEVLFGRRLGVPPGETTISHEAVCIRHDVAWNSLQEFVDDPPGSDIERRVDAAWNPRNKYLADAIAFIEWQCVDDIGLQRLQCLTENPDFWELVGKYQATEHGLRGKFVAEFNDFGWPISDQDVEHAKERPRFVMCDDPVPRASNFRVAQVGSSYRATWDFSPGCAVDLDDVWFELGWTVAGFSLHTGAEVYPNTSCSSLLGEISCSYVFVDGIDWLEDSYVSLYIYVQNRHTGGLYYPEAEVTHVPAPGN